MKLEELPSQVWISEKEWMLNLFIKRSNVGTPSDLLQGEDLEP